MDYIFKVQIGIKKDYVNDRKIWLLNSQLYILLSKNLKLIRIQIKYNLNKALHKRKIIYVQFINMQKDRISI